MKVVAVRKMEEGPFVVGSSVVGAAAVMAAAAEAINKCVFTVKYFNDFC